MPRENTTILPVLSRNFLSDNLLYQVVEIVHMELNLNMNETQFKLNMRSSILCLTKFQIYGFWGNFITATLNRCVLPIPIFFFCPQELFIYLLGYPPHKTKR